MCRGLVVFIGGWRCGHLELGRMRAFPFPSSLLLPFFRVGDEGYPGRTRHCAFRLQQVFILNFVRLLSRNSIWNKTGSEVSGP
jgi:hypothetical protein